MSHASPPSQQQPVRQHGRSHSAAGLSTSPEPVHANLSPDTASQGPPPASNQTHSSSSASSSRVGSGHDARFRASVDVAQSRTGWGNAGQSPHTAGGGPNTKSTGANSNSNSSRARPSSEFLGAGAGSGAQGSYHSAETEAIDRWFEDLQHYETTLEEMAAASLDVNFKAELSAIEQWFRVLSEAERTAALYSLLQSSTQLQMRFFVMVLQQMGRNDPSNAALLSPANPSQLSMEAQMDAKLASMGLKSPASPVIRQFARQSLGASDSYLSPASAATVAAGPPSPVHASADDSPAAASLASQRAKLKASSRTSAPANLLLSANNNNSRDSDAPKSPVWQEREKVVERRSPSPSARPKSTGSTGEGVSPNGAHAGHHLSQSTGPPSSASFLRSPQPDAFDNQLSPLVGGSWASMVNTPLVPMFGGKNGAEPGSTMEPGNFGGGPLSPNLDGANARLGSWQNQGALSPNPNNNGSGSGIVLDDVRKFRRSARVSGGTGGGFSGVSGGALGGMYEDQQQQQQRQQEQQRRAQLTSMQQNAINLGLAGLSTAQQQQQQQSGQQGSQRNANGGLNSPSLISAQQAQQNWRNGLGSPGGLSQNGLGNGSNFGEDQYATLGGNNSNNQLSANAQLASLFALQQQMLAQQQQMQTLNNFAAAGITLTPVQMMGLQQQQAQALLSPGGRMGLGVPMNGMGFNGMNMGMGIGLGGGSLSPRRSPRSSDRSPGGNNHSSSNKSSQPSAAGSGANPDEAIDLNLLADIPQWLRSLRLHKYTPNFEGSNWRDMVILGDAELEAKGVAALGARRKLLLVFATIRKKMGIEEPEGAEVPTTGGATEATQDA